jgi:hypothetical protein
MPPKIPHEIELEITPEGQIKSTVKGVEGPSCEGLLDFLAEMGEIVADKRTPDFFRPVIQKAKQKGGR